MKITRIKEIQWWDPKVKADAVTYKVWVEDKALTELHYFNSQQDLDKFKQQLNKKVKK